MNLEGSEPEHPAAEAFTFGDRHELCRELLPLAHVGKKRTTFGILRNVGVLGPMPVVGRRYRSLDRDRDPALITETTDVTFRRFCDINADFVLAEGEDEKLASWQPGNRCCPEHNGGFDTEIELNCKRFRLIEGFAKVVD